MKIEVIPPFQRSIEKTIKEDPNWDSNKITENKSYTQKKI